MSSRVVRRHGVLLTRSGDQALLVNEEGGHVHVVNATAARVWELCDGSPTVDTLVADFAAAYGKEGGEVRGDIDGILGTFRDLGLIEPAQEA
jgi:PqqD family protein of HPr-rel-A system